MEILKSIIQNLLIILSFVYVGVLGLSKVLDLGIVRGVSNMFLYGLACISVMIVLKYTGKFF